MSITLSDSNFQIKGFNTNKESNSLQDEAIHLLNLRYSHQEIANDLNISISKATQLTREYRKEHKIRAARSNTRQIAFNLDKAGYNIKGISILLQIPDDVVELILDNPNKPKPKLKKSKPKIKNRKTKAIQLFKQGNSHREIADTLKLNIGTIRKYTRDYRLKNIESIPNKHNEAKLENKDIEYMRKFLLDERSHRMNKNIEFRIKHFKKWVEENKIKDFKINTSTNYFFNTFKRIDFIENFKVLNCGRSLLYKLTLKPEN